MSYLDRWISLRESFALARHVIILCDHEVCCETAQASRINSLIAGLTSNNCHVLLIIPKHQNYEKNVLQSEFPYGLSDGSLSIIRIGRKSSIAYALRAFCFTFERLNSSIMLYVSSSNPLQHFFSALLRLCRSSPVILDVGEWHSLDDLLKSWNLKSLLIEWINQRFLIRNYSGVAAISSAIASKCDILKVPYCLIPALLPANPVGLSDTREYPKRSGKSFLRLFYSGTLKKEDGIEAILHAMHLLELDNPGRFKLTTSGSFSKDNLLALYGNSYNNFTIDQIDHKGWLSGDDYLDVITACDLVVIPRPIMYINNRFSFPTRLVQAIALGTPIAISDSTDIPLYLKPNYNYISLGDGSCSSIVRALSRDSLQDHILSVKSRLPEITHLFDPKQHASKLLLFASNLSRKA